MLFRLAETLEAQDRAAAAASLARVLISAGRVDQARPYALDGNDPVLVARLLLEAHDFREARRLLDEARRRDPFDPAHRLGAGPPRVSREALRRSGPGSPRGRAPAARRTARRRRPPVPARRPRARPRRDPELAGSRRRGARPARRGGRAPRAPAWRCPTAPPSCCAPSSAAAPRRREGVLDRARRLAEMPALQGLDEGALFAAAAAGELRRLADRKPALPRGRRRRARSRFVVQGSIDLVRPTPVGDQPMGEAQAGDLVGEEALVGSPRTGDARARGPVTLLGFTADFFSSDPDRAVWLRYLPHAPGPAARRG